MSAVAQGQQAGGKNAPKTSEDNSAKMNEIKKMTRRRIYYHRLIGDDVLAPKIKAHTAAPVWRVARFLVYVVIATWVIWERSDVPTLAEVNEALYHALTRVPYQGGPRPQFFEDIETLDDYRRWVQHGVSNRLAESSASGIGTLTTGVYMLNNNRLMPPMFELCLENSSALVVTMNRMSTETAFADTTSSRFHQLYPETWKGPGHVSGGAKTDATSETLVQPYRTSPSPADACIPDGLLSPANFSGLDGVRLGSWDYTSACSNPADEVACGFQGEGGYVALIFYVPAAAACAGGSPKQLIALISPMHPLTGPYPNLVSASPSGSLQDFLGAGFIDFKMTTFVTSFNTYNANHQTVSKIAASFNHRASGFLRKPDISIRTVKMDIHHSYLQYIEIAYLFTTACYLLELVVRFYRNNQKHIFDLWAYVNLASILCSSLSIFFWYMYESVTQEHLESDQRPMGVDITDLSDTFRNYLRSGAFATLTIYIRMLQMLADTKPRVQLLLNTLSQSVKNMFIYIIFISVVFAGCLVFATTYFSAYSSNFSDQVTAFTTCFLMVFGDTQMFIFQRDAALRLLFYIPYMFFFFIFSVQMFNAIINYTYNKVSESMEPHFEKERMERRRKMSSARSGKSKKSRFAGWCAPLTAAISRVWQSREHQDKKDDASDVKGSKTAKAGEKMVDAQARDAVEEKIMKERNQKAPETVCSMCLYVIFAVSYLMFLWVNLKVEDTSLVMQSLRHAFVKSYTYEVFADTDISYYSLMNVSNMERLETWVSGALPEIIFENQQQPATTLTTGSSLPLEGQYCIGTWNCIVSRQMNLTSAETPKIVRLTQRMLKLTPNVGSRGHTNSTPENARFRAGSELVPWRSSNSPLSPGSGKVDHEDRETVMQLSYNGEVFCDRVAYGDGGYLHNGGIVCLMDADPTAFRGQLAVMELEGFFGSHTGSFAVEVLLHNANANMMSVVDTTFRALPSGLVEPTFHISSFTFINIKEWRHIYLDLALQIVPGLIYVALTFTFIVYMVKDLQNEVTRRKRNENKRNPLRIIWDYFTLDVFNAIDLASFIISIASAILYIVWVVRETNLQTDTSYTSLLRDVSELEVQALIYRQLSAINSLVIFIRPLKFLRENPRIKMFNQTLWEAAQDTIWFVVMLFITMVGFMMFAYVSFGHLVTRLSTVGNAFVFCFYHILGVFDFEDMNRADPLMSWVWFIPYIFIFYCFFLNMFFAIIDRYFVTAEPQPVNFKRKLKPIFSRLCRWIEWDEDYVMDVDTKAKDKGTSSISRRKRVQKTAQDIQQIRDKAYDDGIIAPGSSGKGSKQLSDVCDLDERMNDVLFWSREEAKKFVEEYQAHLNKKQAERITEDKFNKDLEIRIKERQKEDRESMEKAERQKRYAIQVHEKTVVKDQDTLARYILRLERKIEEKMLQKHRLHMEVHHLRAESEKMRFTDQELKNNEEEETPRNTQLAVGRGGKPQAGNALEAHQEEDGEDEESDSSSDDSVQDDGKQLQQQQEQTARRNNDPEGRIVDGSRGDQRRGNADAALHALPSFQPTSNGNGYSSHGNGYSSSGHA
eukprot:CAMPEP_0178457424 /NCGR_PEP_ID=MMETSP0689_2-20121128/47009_1 /TAXON_ID=160604 /ORGANISM="Amphidinium massartii, Strain CS-259" /LENGTH=1560 /DNA_ID=CAMNT_0020083673 /DNA_START=97 /DNA_END=4780 /DNA_ORIENTATION=-